MEELITLRKYIEEKDYIKALELVGELEEMSKEDSEQQDLGMFLSTIPLERLSGLTKDVNLAVTMPAKKN